MQTLHLDQDYFASVLSGTDQSIVPPFPSDSEVDDILSSLNKEEAFEGAQFNQEWLPQPVVSVVNFPPSIAPHATTIVPASPEQHSSISGSPAMSPSTSGQNDDDDDDDDEEDQGKKKRKKTSGDKKVELEFIGLSPEHVAIMSSKEYEDYVKLKQSTMNFTKEQQKHIKWVRRKILNREYAVQCRKKKAAKSQDLETRVKELEHENALLKQQVAQLAQENHQLRSIATTSASSTSSNRSGHFLGIGGRNASAACLLVLLFSFGLWFSLPTSGLPPAGSSLSSSSTGRVLFDADGTSVSSWWLRLLYGTRAIESKPKPPPSSAAVDEKIPVVETVHEDELQCLTHAEIDRIVAMRVNEQILKTTAERRSREL